MTIPIHKYPTHEENRRKEERKGEREKEEGEAPVAAVARQWYPGDCRIVEKLRSEIIFFFIKYKMCNLD